MKRCSHCRKEIRGDSDCFDAGARLSTGEIIKRDVVFCGGENGCLAPWLLAHYPVSVGKVYSRHL